MLNRTADATGKPPKTAAVSVGPYAHERGVRICITDIPSQMLRDLAAALQLQDSNRAAREKLTPQHIYVNRRARLSAVDGLALAPRGPQPLSVECAERFVRHDGAVYGVVRRLP
ncbi:MAG TPA: hypothetical protein VK337_13010 [Xanthobacteraceae bacterium]|nr:hypothetical protein [Xanthobacteraceae bacterium]